MRLIYHDVNHYDTNGGVYRGLIYRVKCICNRDWPNRGPTCAMSANMYYVYLEVNIVIIVYMDLEFVYMDIYGLLGIGFPHEK